MKLISVYRHVNTYDTEWELVAERIIDIPLNMLLTIVSAKEDDPLLYDGYELNDTQMNMINDLLETSIPLNFGNENYVLEATGVYE